MASLDEPSITPIEPAPEPESKDTPELAIRSTGEHVVALQESLNDHLESGLQVDGIFGPVTLREVRMWQQHENLPVTGIVDADTWKSLGH